MINYSPEYKLNKLNNYDNTVKNVSRQIYETCDFTKNFPMDGTRNSQIQQPIRVNHGSFMGPGHRAVLYGSWTKKQEKPSTSVDQTKLNLRNKPLINEIRN